jgi:hypothetical protein
MLALAEEAVARKPKLDDRVELIQAHLPDELPGGRFDAITPTACCTTCPSR